MQNVILIVHLILALCLIGIVLLQRSEGGGLGMGGGGSITGRAPTTPLGKLTWVFAAAFIGTSVTLTILAAQNAAGTSVVDRIAPAPQAPSPQQQPAQPQADGLMPPAPVAPGGTPLPPPRAD